MTRHNTRAAAAALALVSVAAVPLAAAPATQKKPVKAPKDGATYKGHHPGVMIAISGKSIQIIAFRFPCKQVKGNTSLQDIKLHKTDKGYRFKIEANSIVTYSDSDSHDHPDENAAIRLGGHFSRNAKNVTGHLRVIAPRCDTGKILWSAVKS
jgi:hypothetical protein